MGIASTRVANDEFGLGVVTGSNSAEVLLWCEDIDAAYAAALAAGGTPAAWRSQKRSRGNVRNCREQRIAIVPIHGVRSSASCS